MRQAAFISLSGFFAAIVILSGHYLLAMIAIALIVLLWIFQIGLFTFVSRTLVIKRYFYINTFFAVFFAIVHRWIYHHSKLFEDGSSGDMALAFFVLLFFGGALYFQIYAYKNYTFFFTSENTGKST
jgi:hypothetical protein